MSIFKEYASCELANIPEEDLRKLKTEIEYEIKKAEEEKLDELFQNVIEAIDELINVKDDICFEEGGSGYPFNWSELKYMLIEYHKYH